MVLAVARSPTDPLNSEAEADQIEEAVGQVQPVDDLASVDAPLVQVEQLCAFDKTHSGWIDHRRGGFVDQGGARWRQGRTAGGIAGGVLQLARLGESHG